MRTRRIGKWLLLLIMMGAVLYACSPAASPTIQVNTPAGQPGTAAPQPTPATTAAPLGTQLPAFETRHVELEYPASMDLGSSDTIRLTLKPSADGYQVQAEFPEHQVSTESVTVTRPAGYTLLGVARLSAAGFELDPRGDQSQTLDAGQTATWRWSVTPRSGGTHRLALSLALRWQPLDASHLAPPDQTVYTTALTVNVRSILGLSPQGAAGAGVGLLIMAGVAVAAILAGRMVERVPVENLRTNPRVVIEPLPGSPLNEPSRALLQAVFARYARVLIEAEFRSGYSGSRTWLALPIHADGRHDARAIVKIGREAAISGEYYNYEKFVKDTLPPVTARVQQPPARADQRGVAVRCGVAALRYTFIGQAGQPPRSLKQALLEDPNPAYLETLFDTFAPGWWLQRSPASFHLGVEYDRILPAHLLINALPPGDPACRKAALLSALTPPADLHLFPGDIVRLSGFTHFEPRADSAMISIESSPEKGLPVLRLRWMPAGASVPGRGVGGRNSDIGRVAALRRDLIAQSAAGLERYGLPDPLQHFNDLLGCVVHGATTTIHGDLNLENILVGPGGLVWLIDFAQTRRGDPMVDFAHLYGEIVAHVLAEQCGSPQAYLDDLRSGAFPLLRAVDGMAAKVQVSEDHRRAALAITCLGMLKYANLTPAGRQCLYLTSAYYCG